MTAHKRFKRRVRERARRTGESYTAALRNLRHVPVQEQKMTQQHPDQPEPAHRTPPDPGWERIEVTEFGYALHLPVGWQRRDPDLRNSPWETARFAEPTDRRHSLIVFRSPVRPGADPTVVAERAQHALAAALFTDFTVQPVPFAGRPGRRLDCVRHDAGRVWAVTQFYAVGDASAFCLGFGSTAAQEDESLFVQVAQRFELLPTDPAELPPRP
jgi:hypothetical protein